uniref:Uncharacterized protein n=1 Tax=Anguilla anguilla TaxID=7936 RepID=A0A0E9VLI7_ANGAN
MAFTICYVCSAFPVNDSFPPNLSDKCNQALN